MHLGRHVELSEERYRLEVDLEGAMSEVLEGLERFRKLDADQHREAQAGCVWSIAIAHSLWACFRAASESASRFARSTKPTGSHSRRG